MFPTKIQLRFKNQSVMTPKKRDKFRSFAEQKIRLHGYRDSSRKGSNIQNKFGKF